MMLKNTKGSSKTDDASIYEWNGCQSRKNADRIREKVETAKGNHEKFYSMDEILKANAQEFGISEEDMNKIKESVATHKEGLSVL